MPSVYGFLISFSILVCILVAQNRAKACGQSEDFVWSLALVSILSGIAGARLYHVLDLWAFYAQSPIKVFYLWNGGLGIWGGIVAAAAGATVYLKIKKANMWVWLDLMASVAPLGQTVGRWGNYINHENFGLPTNLPWGINIPGVVGKSHPLFLYESILDFLLFVFLSRVYKKYGFGTRLIFTLYIVGYSLIRFSLEFLRVNPWIIRGIPTAQIVSLFAGGTAIISYAIYRFRSQRV